VPAFASAEAIDPAQLYQQTLRGVVLVLVDDGSGSGWLIDRERRLIVTNHHVAGTSDEIRVYFPRFENGELVTSRAAYVQKRGLRGQEATVARPTARGDDPPGKPAKGSKAADLVKKGDQFKDQKKYDEALAAYADAIQIDPDYVLAYTQRAWIFNEQGKYAE